MKRSKGKENFFIDTVVFTIISYNQFTRILFSDKEKKITQHLHKNCWDEEFVKIKVFKGVKLNNEDESRIFRNLSQICF